MPRPFIKFHSRVINLEAISDVELAPDGAVIIRMVAPGAVFRLEGEEAKSLLSMLAQLWVDSRH
jgi:hypothetical protein